MVKQIVTKLSVAMKTGLKKGTVYRSPRIYLSTKLTEDSTFPFFEGEEIKIEIAGSHLIVSRFKGAKRRKRAPRKRRR